MDIKDFLDLNQGSWFSQRTTYNLQQEKADSCKSELIVEYLSATTTDVISLCQEINLNPELTIGGTKTSWDTSLDTSKPKQKGHSLIILMPETDNCGKGRIITKNSQLPNKLMSGRYILGDDEALTLLVEDKTNYFEERIWFAIPNLRLRTTLIKPSRDFGQTCFYSEIRKVPSKN